MGAVGPRTQLDGDSPPERGAAAGARSKRLRRLLLGAFALAVVLAGAVAFLSMSVRADLEATRRALESGRDAVAAGEMARAEELVARAAVLAERAEARARSLPMRIAGLVPVAGRSVRAVANLATAARLGTDAAREGVRASSFFPQTGGRLDYRPRAGRLDITPWRRARPALERMHALAERAIQEARRAPATWLAGPVARAREEAVARLDELADLSGRLAVSARVLPSALGFAGPQRYLLVFQNPAELRATGGLVGGFAVIEAAQGRLRLRDVASNVQLRSPDEPVPMPSWFRARYDPWNTRLQWNQSNFEPDFRYTGMLLGRMFERTTGIDVDGVIATDPFGMAELLRETGPVAGPHGLTATADSFAKLILIDEYRLFPDDRQGPDRKALFVDLAARVWSRALRQTDLRRSVAALGRAARGRHLMMWSEHGSLQRAFLRLDLAGTFRGIGGVPFVGVVNTNLAPSKVDAFLHRSIDLDISLDRDGNATVRMRLRFRNAVPDGLPHVVLGPTEFSPAVQPGESLLGTEIYLPREAAPSFRIVRGDRREYFLHQPPDAFVSRPIVVDILPGRTEQLEASWRIERAVDPSGRLRLRILRQPAPNPDTVSVRITVPRDTVLRAGDPAFDRDGRTYRWRDSVERDVDIDAVVARTLWGRVKDVLGRPIF